jgi:7-cyano-7-deazaguanine reductase
MKKNLLKKKHYFEKSKKDSKNYSTKKISKSAKIDIIDSSSNLSLGKPTNYQFSSPNIDLLQNIDNPHIDVDYVIRFTCPEFTSLCPITSQPDFAHLIIEYVADKKLIESKSLKLYLFSFRNHGAFHEDCTIRIAKDLIKLCKPKWLRLTGYWFPRGGIPIDIFFQSGLPPKNIFLSDNSSYNYKAR